MKINEVMQPFYECKYCSKKMAKKAAFDKHECESLKRHKLCQTKAGLSAFENYKYWLQQKNKKLIKQVETFVKSKYFTSFILLQEFFKKKGVPDTKMYIDYMLERSIPPSLWRSDEIYEKFIAHFDSEVTPAKKMRITLETLDTLAAALECPVNEVFRYMYPSEIATLVHERRLSPWILLCSPKFMHYMHMVKDPVQRTMLTTTINVRYWGEILSEDKKSTEKAKAIVEQLKL